MKAKLIVITGVLVALVASYSVASAQTLPEAPVKILPTEQIGIFKIIYAATVNEPVVVKFIADDNVFSLDRIKGDNMPNGFLRRYDVRHVKADVFWIEVSSPQLSVTYKMTDAGNGEYHPILETATYNHTLVANNR